jgi:hypothetical protein
VSDDVGFIGSQRVRYTCKGSESNYNAPCQMDVATSSCHDNILSPLYHVSPQHLIELRTNYIKELTTWIRKVLEKLIFIQFVKKFTTFVELEG